MPLCCKRLQKAFLFLTLLYGVTFAQPLTVTVGESKGLISPDAITGFNYGLSMQVALYAEEFGMLNLRGLRYPPGNDADNFPLTTDMMDALRVQWELMGEPEPLIVANFFEGPEHALHAARYLQEIGLPVRYWAVGNEPDLYPRNRMDPSWTPEVYCERFRAFAAALKAFDPHYVVTGPAVSGSRPLGKDYLREILFLCGDVIDVLTWHVYPTDGTWTDEAALATSAQVGEEIRLFRGWLGDPEMNPLGYERDIGLAITEFGLSWRTPNYRHLEDMIAALWLADALGQMATEGLDWSHYFALQAMGGHGLIDRGGWVRPTYFVYEMLSDFTGEALAVDVVELEAPVSAYAAQNERGLQVLLVNQATEDAEVVLEAELEGELEGNFELRTLNDEIFDELLAYRITTQGSDVPIAVPARSVVLVRASK